MAVTHGPRGLPGNQGLKGTRGVKGDKGDAGIGVTITNNGNGTYTLTGANGSIILKDGKDGATVVGQAGDYLSTVYGKVPVGDAAPTIDPGSGSYTGAIENPPTGSVNWTTQPNNEVGYSTYVSTNRYVNNSSNNTWSLLTPIWSTPVIYYVGDKVKNKFVSWIFIRSNSIPIRPTGGSYSNPMPNDTNWSDGIPAGDSPLYASKRLFTEDGNAPQDPQWSEPKLHGGNNEISFRYAEEETDPAPWAENPLPIHNWMVACHKTPNGTWNCDYSKKMKISGESGTNGQSVIYASAFKRSSIDLSTIAGNTADPGDPPNGVGERPEGGSFYAPWPTDTQTVQGWQDEVPEGTGNIYISNRIFTNDREPPQEELWSPARLWSGANARSLILKPDTFIFSYDNEDPPNITPNEIIITAETQNIDEDVIWSTEPQALIDDPTIVIDNTDNTLTLPKDAFVTAIGSTLSSVKIIATVGSGDILIKDEVTIIKLSEGYSPIPGIDYNDKGGALTHSVYILSKNKPNRPTGGSYNGVNDPVNPNGTDNPNTGKSWLDDPQQITGDYKLWVSVFKYIPKLGSELDAPWGASTQPGTGGGLWSDPVEFVYIPREGVDFFSENKFISYVFRNVLTGTDLSLTPPSGGTYLPGRLPNAEITPNDWTDDPETPDEDQITWVSSRTYERNSNNPTGLWLAGNWSAPSKFSGTAGVSGILTNENHSVAADYLGKVNSIEFNDAGGNFKVYMGTKDVTNQCTFKVQYGSNVSGNWNEIIKSNNLALRIQRSGATAGMFELRQINTGWTPSIHSETFELIATHTNTSYTVTKRYTISKVLEGAAGDSGLANRMDIAYSSSANGASNFRGPTLTFNPRVYTKATPNSTSKYIGTNVLTWTPDPDILNTKGEPYPQSYNKYEWVKITGDNGADGMEHRIDFAYAETVNLLAQGTSNNDGGNASSVTGFTLISNSNSKWLGTNIETGNPPGPVRNIQSFYEWTRITGEDGVGALSVVLSNQAHTVPTNSSGNNGDFSNSSTAISVYEGTTKLDYDASGTSPGKWKVTASNTNLTRLGISPLGTLDAVSGVLTSMTANTAKTDFTVTGRTSKNTPFNLSIQQSFAKSLAGSDGNVAAMNVSNQTTSFWRKTGLTHGHQAIGNNFKLTLFGAIASVTGTGGLTHPPTNGTVKARIYINNVNINNDITLTINSSPGEGMWDASFPLTILDIPNTSQSSVSIRVDIIGADNTFATNSTLKNGSFLINNLTIKVTEPF